MILKKKKLKQITGFIIFGAVALLFVATNVRNLTQASIIYLFFLVMIVLFIFGGSK